MTLTSEQLRAARALLRIEQSGLAERSGVSLATIKRLETAPGTLTGAQASTVSSLRLALEEAGVIFLDDKEGTPRGGPGVRLAEAEPEFENVQIKTALSIMAKTIEAAAEKLGIGKKDIGQIVKDAEAETYLKISRDTMRKALGPNSLPDSSRSVQQLRESLKPGWKPPAEDESE